LTPDFALIENHVIDSLGLLLLITFLEEHFGIQLADEEVVPEHFGAIGAIAMVIEKKAAERDRVG